MRLCFAAFGAALALGVGPAAADHINVSKIATGTQVNLDWNASAAKPKVSGATISWFTLATGQIDTEAGPYFVAAPWTAALAAQPTYPLLQHQAINAPYTQGTSTFEYDTQQSRLALVDMVQGKKVQASTAFKGSASAAATLTYRARIDHTSAQALDYFIDLAVPLQQLGAQPGYNLCCSGDPDGGTYNYIRPKSWAARGEVDVYVDGLPVWSSANTAIYPDDPGGTPFDSVQVAWDKPKPPDSTTLYLGRLSSGQSMTITLEVRTDARADSDCGIQPPGSYLSHTYEIHCYRLSESAQMSGGSGGQPVGFSLYSKAPPP
jgi:hypothetical protein